MQGQHFCGGVGGALGGWDGNGEEICASRLVNHTHAAGPLSIRQSI